MTKHIKSRKLRPLKKGDLIYLKNVGFPFNRTDGGYESWEGASCTVLSAKAGHGGSYILVRPILPINGGFDPIPEGLFHPEQCVRENRPWLKKHLKDIVKLREQLNTLADAIKAHLS